jgi:hypothetical protein
MFIYRSMEYQNYISTNIMRRGIAVAKIRHSDDKLDIIGHYICIRKNYWNRKIIKA